jgi:hypothetical protein
MIQSAFLRKIGAIWGVGGVILLLGFAMYRLVPFATELLKERLGVWQLIILVVWCAVMLYSEGYKAFGQQFAPRVVARAQYLTRQARLRELVLAPLFCVGYFGAPKRRVITAYALATGIITLIVVVHFVPQPWRGIIDVGVVLGLAYGIVSLVTGAAHVLRNPSEYLIDPEIPARAS